MTYPQTLIEPPKEKLTVIHQGYLYQSPDYFYIGLEVQYIPKSSSEVPPVPLKVQQYSPKADMTVSCRNAEGVVELYPKDSLFVKGKGLWAAYKDKATKEMVDFVELLKVPGHTAAIDKAVPEIPEGYTKHVSADYTLFIPTNHSVNEKLPVIMAHTDIVFSVKHPTETTLEFDQDTFMFGSPNGLGADDRAGMWVIQKIVESLGELQVLPIICFFDKEEIGCVGSSSFGRSELFVEVDKVASMYISIDRRRDVNGGKTLATYGHNNASLLVEVANVTGRTIVNGSSTDCAALSRASSNNVPCFNMSCGYQAEHTKNEVLYFKEMEETLKDLKALLNTDICTKEWKATPTMKQRQYHGNAMGFGNAMYDDWDDYSYYGGYPKKTKKAANVVQPKSTIKLNKKVYNEDDLKALLAQYAYHTGKVYTLKDASIDMPTDSIIVELKDDVRVDRIYAGQRLTKSLYDTLSAEHFEVWRVSENDLKVDIIGTDSKTEVLNVPWSLLQEVPLYGMTAVKEDEYNLH